MQKENKITVGQWCDHWFQIYRSKWNGNTEGGYRNLIYSHILPGVGSIELTGLTEQMVNDFYDELRSQGLSARSVWCVHLLLRRCLDEAAREQLMPYNPVRLCPEPKTEEYKTAPLRLGQIQRYLNAAEKCGVLPIIYINISARRIPMFEMFGLLFAWLPTNLAALLISFISIFILAFFVGLILKIIDIIRG